MLWALHGRYRYKENMLRANTVLMQLCRMLCILGTLQPWVVFSCRMSINMYRCINIFWLIYTCYLICLTLTTWPVATWIIFITIQTIYNAWICSSHDCLQGWNWVGSSGLSRSTGSHFVQVKRVRPGLLNIRVWPGFCIVLHALIMASVPDQSNELSVLDDDDGSVSPDFLYHNYFEGLTLQLEYFDRSVLW